MASVSSISSQYGSDAALQSKLILDAYGGGTQGWIKDMCSGFFRDINNMPYVRAVMSFYNRDVPAQDTHNHWDDQYFFWTACVYFKQFGMPINNTDPGNCGIFKGLQTALMQAQEEADKLNANGTASGVVYQKKAQVLSDLTNYVNTAFATLQCDFVLTSQQQNNQLAVLQQATQTATTTASSGTGGGYTTYIIYAVLAIIVIAVLAKIFKHK